MNDTPDNTHYRLSIRRPVTVAMMFITLLVFGWRSYQQLPLNLMPDISYPTLTIRTDYDGAAPEDVEKLVTRQLEERLSIVAGVVEVSSVSSAGLSEIILEFTWDTDMNVAMQDVRESLDQFTRPQGVNRNPIILRYDPTLDPVMRVAIRGRDLSHIIDDQERAYQLESDLTEIREAAEDELKGDLEAEPGIAQVVVKGGREDEIQIMLDSARLKSLGLTPENIVMSLQQQNVNLSGGRLKEGRAEYLVRTMNEFQNVEEIRAVVVLNATGEQFRLSDVARVDMGTKERETIVRVNGQEAVELEFYKEGSANVVQVSEKLRNYFQFEQKESIWAGIQKKMAENDQSGRMNQMMEAREKQQQRKIDRVRKRLPEYASPVLITDQARFIEASVNEVKSTAVLGGLLALCVLFLFLRELRSTIIIGVAIPISVVATFVPMYMQGISLNIMSLGGLALGIGMLVDNSIVVLESIFRCREEGDDIIHAADRGTKEVSSAVTASTLTTIAVFFPIVFVDGIAGQMFRDLALTVTFSLIASLLVALYLIPMIASREGMVLTHGESVVWILRAFREGRSEGKGRGASLAGIPKRGFGYIKEWIGQIWGDTIGVVNGHRKSEKGVKKVGYTVLLPVMAVLLVLQLVLKTAATIAVTVITFNLMVILGILWCVGKVLKLVFYLPVHIFEHGFLALRGAYGLLLRQMLHFSPVLIILIVVLGVYAAQRSTSLGRELIPPMKQGEFSIRVETEPGTRLEETESRAQKIELIARSFEVVDNVTMQVGSDNSSGSSEEGENVAVLTVKLVNPAENAVIQDGIIEEIRKEILDRSNENITFELPTLFSFKTAMEVQFFGEELDTLKEIGDEAMERIQFIPGMKDAELSLKQGYPEIHVMMDREILTTKELTPVQIAQLLRTEVQGDIATRFNRGGEKVDIRVRSDQTALTSLQDLKMLSVRDGNPPVPLQSVAEIRIEEGPSEIRRIDQQQVVLITANVEGRDLGGVAGDIEEQLAEMDFPEGYSYLLGGQNKELETSYGGLIFALALAVFLVYVVMACQFESVFHPALIMFSVPLAFIGVIFMLDYLEVNISIIVFIGGIVLAGIVVNGAIVLVDYINQLRARGMKKADAIVQACTVRFRPILMTTMTTVLGLIPMVLSTGEGAEIRVPMALTVMAGLLSGTLLTLFVIPMVYQFFGGRDKEGGPETA
jgi:HAE1 family hydrophobic/amphiphilic exporter-1